MKSKRELLRGKVLQLREIIQDVEERIGPDVDLPMDISRSFESGNNIANPSIVGKFSWHAG